MACGNSGGETVNLCEPMEMTIDPNENSNQYLDLDNIPQVVNEEIIIIPSEPSKRGVSTVTKSSYNCLICGKKFNQNAGRYNHMKKVHNVFRGDKTNIRCLEKGCSFRCSYKEKLQLHLAEEHGVNMDIRIKTFNNYSDFLRWKEEFEKQEKTRFVKKSGSRPKEKGVRVVYFYCSRSGTNIPQNNVEKQNLKRKLTTKSSHHCTASITCIELANGQVEVKVCATHYGHDSDLQQLRLTQTDKIQIVEQLIKGVPRDVVLDNIRSSASSEVDRIHLITMKDVKNIEKAYGIHSKNSNEIISTNSCNINQWVLLMGQSEHSPVVYFDEQGTSDLVNYEFTLVIMTVGQVEMAKKYGQSRIFYIPTYATDDNKYFSCNQKNIKYVNEIHVATLIVVDNSNEALPISFMISTRASRDKYKLFFERVKEKVPELDAKAVLTDDNSGIFEAWTSVFTSETGEKPCHLWSNRFVDKDWRDNLIAIPNEEVQVSVYEKLYSYLESPDENKGFSCLKDYVDNELLTNPLTIQFGNHFSAKYLGSEHFWAGCFGKRNVPIHAQLNMERLSNEVEEVVDRKHYDKRFIVRTVQDLLKLISDNQCYRQTKVQKQIQDLPNHHKLGLKINPESIFQETPISWRVNSSKDPTNIFSIVTKKEKNCFNSTGCLSFCIKCGACAHEFECSCRFYAFDKSMCKHIHAVVTNFFDQSHFLTEPEDNSQSMERELAQLKYDCLWGRLRRKKRDRESSTEIVTEQKPNEPELTQGEEQNFLPILDEIIHNKKSKEARRKRGRPRKNVNQNSDESLKKSVNDDSKKSHRSKVNILRKNRKSSQKR